MKNQLKGTGVALVTPFHKDGSIDFNCFKNLIEHIIKGKAEYLVPLGTTGESVTLSKDEKQAVLDFVIEINNGRLPVVVGIGGNNTQEVVSTIQKTNLEGVDAILSVSPAYNKPTQKGIYAHYKVIANESPLPVIIYNVPARTACNVKAETTLSLAEDFSNIIGVKEASGNIMQCMQLAQNRPKNFLLLSGEDALTFPLIGLGFDGVISVVANAYTRPFTDMVRHALSGEYTKARNLHYKLLDVTNLLFVEGNPAGIKAALAILDLCKDNLRLPLVGISRSLNNKLSAAMEKL